ncbi:glycoside hydrolase family 15 protein [Ilyomonas limi]|uniref:Glycoside hydrolase family 15 protein n=1 Tax=Ilyomonas limi TaxID=2575867 RepID=A0A4U3KXP9_9BACT|nr:glycoside hydrolase family 15 protein [Ilyomonas limi]TKK67230.1 glycoside hydrolase family 15 protein [Ilyomonas limi]
MNKQQTSERYPPIENYGVIGNLNTVALVSLNCSIDFLSYTRFDSPTIFCKLLDADKGGSFSVCPEMVNMVSKQLYLPDTNVLVTRFFAEEGIAEIIDFMPIQDGNHGCTIIRKIATIRGRIKYNMRCSPRFNYADTGHRIHEEKDAYIFTPNKGDQPPFKLYSTRPLTRDGQDATASFTLKEGEYTCMVLDAHEKKGSVKGKLEDYVENSYQATIRFWQNWLSNCTYNGRWREEVNRSALALKLLFSKQYGSIIAAATTSLPETIGGERNWDYRYTWIRDAAFSMHAFLELGFMDEAKAFLQWVRKRSTDEELQLMFAIDGRTDLKELELAYMEGYKGSQPVRIGNAAHAQDQMDIYGELLETIYIYVTHGGDLTYDYWKIIVEYIDYVIENWHKPDCSIWEVRGEEREFLFSRMMCWVAMDRAIKIADHFSFPYDFLQWRTVRDDIYKDIYENFWNEKKQSFVQSKGSYIVDASALLMPILNVISPFSRKWELTMDAIDRDLRSDVLVYRYREDSDEVDGLKGKEGTFTICSFWHVECLALSGRLEEAKEHFEKMLGYANHLGLYSEQIGMRGEHLGNFPQAFTHLSLISAAVEIDKQELAHRKTLPFLHKEMK